MLWLDGVDRKYIEEVGAMNIFFKIDGKVCTPELGGSILSGITRKSVIELLKDWGVPVIERKISIDEIVAAHKASELEEMFGTGTAAVISPVGHLRWNAIDMTINGGKIGELSKRLYDELTDTQWGKKPDLKNWIVKVK